MKTLDRKLLREVLGAKGLLLAITSIVAVGVTCYVSLQSAYYNLNGAKGRYYRQCRMADFWIDLKKVPTAELDRLARLPGVSEIRPRIGFAATVDLEDVSEPLNGQVLSLPDRREHTINDIVLVRGSYFTDRRASEVIVNDVFAAAHGLHPGQRIHLLLNNRRQELFIVGTAISSEFTYLLGPGAIIPDPKRFGVFYIKRSYAEEVFDFKGAANQVVGLLAPEVRRRPDPLLRRAEAMLEPYGVFAVTPRKLQASNQYLSNEILGLKAFAAVAPIIFLVVAALVLNILLVRLVQQQRTIVGTLKALGYTDLQVFSHFLKFGLTVGIAGGLLGSLLGYLCAAGMISMYHHFFQFPDLRNDVYVSTHAIGMSVSLLCATAGSLRGARSVLRLAPAEAMRPAPPRVGGAIVLERFGRLWAAIGLVWRMALRSIFRNRFRTAAGVFAAAMGAGLLVCGLMMNESIHALIDFQFHRVVRSDIDLAFKDERGRDVLSEVERLPGVDYAEPTLTVPCTFIRGPYRRKAAVTGLLPDARLTVPRNADGRRLRLPTAGLIMNRRLAGILHVAPGQSVTIKPIKGRRRPMVVPVAKISDGYMGMAVYADLTYLSGLIDEPFTASGAQILTDGDPEHLRRLHHTLKQLPEVQSVTSRHDLIANLTETILKHQWTSIGMLMFFAGVIFFGSILNASLVSLAERQREVATFGALGYSPWQIGGMFLRESLLTNMTGTVLGLPVGYLLMLLTAWVYNNDLIRLPVVARPWIGATTVVASIVFALAAHGFVQWQIHRMNYVEALKTNE